MLSVALFGTGAGGPLLKKLTERRPETTPDTLFCQGVFVSSIVLFIALLVITRNPFHPVDASDSPETIILFSVLEFISVSAVLTLFFAIVGAMLLLPIRSWPDKTGLYYGTGLFGSAAGCLIGLLAVTYAGSVNGFLLLVAGLATSVAVVTSGKYRLLPVMSGLLAVCMIGLLPFSGTLLPLKALPGKPILQMENRPVLHQETNSMSRLDVFRADDSTDGYFGIWGLPHDNRAPIPERLAMFTDFLSYSTLIRHENRPGHYDFLKTLPMYSVYSAAPESPDVLVIGAGAGLDVRAALEYQAKSIDAVEVNSAITDAVQNKFSDYSGNLYDDKRVQLYIDDGRHFAERTSKAYDLIQLNAVETYCATQSGAFNLTENYLFTREGFSTFLNRLTPDGNLTVSRWYTPSADGFPRFSMRLFILAHEALTANGVKSPENHLLLFRSENFAVLVVSKSPFTGKALAIYDQKATQNNYVFLYRPDKVIFTAMKFYSYIKAIDKKKWLKAYPFDVTAPTDNRPFYYETRKIESFFSKPSSATGYTLFDGQTILLFLLIITGIVSGAFLLTSATSVPGAGKNRAKPILYFFLTGFGFMLVETTLVQQYILPLGRPVYAVSIVLFSFLVFSGFGSLCAESITRRIRGAILPVIISLILISGVVGFHKYGLWITGLDPLAARSALLILMTGIPAFFMGMLFPVGINCFSSNDPGSGTEGFWLWSCTGSVTGTIFSVFISVEAGFQIAILIAASAYLITALLLKNQQGRI